MQNVLATGGGGGGGGGATGVGRCVCVHARTYIRGAHTYTHCVDVCMSWHSVCVAAG